jgi:hypothetical protein
VPIENRKPNEEALYLLIYTHMLDYSILTGRKDSGYRSFPRKSRCLAKTTTRRGHISSLSPKPGTVGIYPLLALLGIHLLESKMLLISLWFVGTFEAPSLDFLMKSVVTYIHMAQLRVQPEFILVDPNPTVLYVLSDKSSTLLFDGVEESDPGNIDIVTVFCLPACQSIGALPVRGDRPKAASLAQRKTRASCSPPSWIARNLVYRSYWRLVDQNGVMVERGRILRRFDKDVNGVCSGRARDHGRTECATDFFCW